MKKYYLTDFDFNSAELDCCAERLEQIIKSLPSGSELVLTRGVYPLKRRIRIENKCDFILNGEGALFSVHFDNTDLKGLDGALAVVGCKNVEIANLFFDYDVSPNMAGRITAIDRDNGTFELKIFDSFKCRGNERFEAFNSVDEEYTPDYKLVTYGECEKEYLGNNVFRIFAAKSNINLDGTEPGQLVCIRHVKYGPSLIDFANVDTCTVRDLTVYAAAGLVYVISPRCKDFSFIRCKLVLPSGSERIFTSNADGMHIVGLTGKLYMKDCYFENMGDDALNMHSTAGTVFETDPENNTFKCVYGRVNLRLENLLPKNWAMPGDILNIYEQESFAHVASVRVLSYEGYNIKYETVFGSFEKGNIVGNTAYYAETHIDGCSVYNTRARAFLFQAENVTVENCHISGMSGCAMILSPDIRKWHEVGPCKNVVIRNNLIEKCGYSKSPSNIGAIAVKCCHDAGLTDSPAGVHENITIEGNTFRNLGDSGVFALAVKGLNIKNNRFENCSINLFSEDVESLKYDIAVMNCDDAVISGNVTTKSEDKLVHMTNVKML